MRAKEFRGYRARPSAHGVPVQLFLLKSESNELSIVVDHGSTQLRAAIDKTEAQQLAIDLVKFLEGT